MICLVTDRRRLANRLSLDSDSPQVLDLLVDIAGDAVEAGVDVVQVRESDLPTRALTNVVRRLVDIAHAKGSMIVVNDRLDVALAAGAHGVHLKEAPIVIDRIRFGRARGFQGGAIDSFRRSGTRFNGRLRHRRHCLSHPFEAGRAPHWSRRARGCRPQITRTPVLGIGGIRLEHLSNVAATGAAGIAAVELSCQARSAGCQCAISSARHAARSTGAGYLRIPGKSARRTPMDSGVRSPLIDFFRRGEVARDVRLVAAQGAFAPRALDQLALLLILKDDADPDIAREAASTLDRLPEAALSAFLGRSEVPTDMRAFFVSRGVQVAAAAESADDPLIDAVDEALPAGNDSNVSVSERVAMMSILEKMKAAMRGTREERAILVRDPNRLVAAAVLSSPKLTGQEVEAIAKMTNVGEEVLRVIGTNRQWTKNYGVVAGLVRNAKTPVAVSLNLLQRINDRDVKLLALDRNIPEPVRMAARRRAANAQPG